MIIRRDSFISKQKIEVEDIECIVLEFCRKKSLTEVGYVISKESSNHISVLRTGGYRFRSFFTLEISSKEIDSICSIEIYLRINLFWKIFISVAFLVSQFICFYPLTFINVLYNFIFILLILLFPQLLFVFDYNKIISLIRLKFKGV